ncbi:FAD linked oxidase domain-containing protein [Bacillus sp. OxB-1]|uniref:FAD-binding oxidoreductase n=1 Tax=Bacillus sp. (strain OxB-1) TaxID=98228 RepID=UPI000582296B|nr:FAD-linked oxidase C-terminal domain-containing protein [Bacillus sp. OxB-1]BAQ09132.1 FAD linked oxidase domain-containing protein [Bacillus sp. OxB-1]
MEVTAEGIFESLREVLSDVQVTTNETVRELRSKDESYHESHKPDVVVFPTKTEDVVNIMEVARKHKVPVVPFGLGSGLEGQAIPLHGGITVDFSLMNKILEIREDDLLVTVQPGVTRSQLNQELKKHGLFFTVDPGADATLGGMAATNASGTTSVRYGVMRDQVRDLEVVLPDGNVIHTGGLAAKSSSGYHLNGLFVGSEGTLGSITELTLRVYGIPEHILAARASFPTIKDAIESVVTILQAGIPIARVELLDEASMKQVNLHSETDYEEKPTLFLEFHGNEAGLQQDVEFLTDIVKDHHCSKINFEKDNAARTQLWEARHNLAYAYMHGYPGKRMIHTDVCVPISELANAVLYARERLDAAGLPAGLVGHVGDGNFHTLLMVDMDDAGQLEKVNDINKQIVMYALERGGTCTGEHGVGIGKQKYQTIEHGTALAVMNNIKKVLDPANLMNPGKIF